MTIVECIASVRKFFRIVLGENCRVLTAVKEADTWKAVCEVLVDQDYTTRQGLGDIVEIYEVYVNEEQEVTGYKLVATKRRAEIDEE